MKLHIKHIKKPFIKRIDGKVQSWNNKYFVYKRVFGFFKMYIKLSSRWESNYLSGNDICINFTYARDEAYDFESRDEAERFIKRATDNPHRFISFN